MTNRRSWISVPACCQAITRLVIPAAFALALLFPAGPVFAQGGGCCLPNGQCQQLSACNCILQGGFFFGAGSQCQPGQQCHGGVGCCVPNTTGTANCVFVDPNLCAQLGGTSFPGTCNNPTAPCGPDPTGACCCNGQTCVDTSQTLCNFVGGVFAANTTCAVFNPCGGACCGPAFGQCTIVPFNQCLPPLTWVGNATCNPNPCIPTGFVQCCFNGNCTFASYCDCVFKNGTPFPNGGCVPGAPGCPDPTGACCIPATGICVNTTLTVCTQYLNGQFFGGATCNQVPCNVTPGVVCCCMGSCKITDPQMCTLANGIVISSATTCQPSPCFGACCDPASGNCILTDQVTCAAAGGTYLAGTTACNPNPCTGACCDQAGNCTPTTQLLCPVPPNLTWFGLNVPCTPTNPCIPTGACCDPVSGQCTLVAAGNCPAPFVFLGNGTTCQPNPCVRCCQNGNCFPIPAGSAACPPGSTQVVATSCGPPNNPCPPALGACCTPNGCIGPVPANQCPAPNQWMGTGSVCNPNPCPGVCCDPATGNCVYPSTQQTCQFPVFLPFPNTCVPPNNPCLPPPPPNGACCDPKFNNCTITIATNCVGRRIYLGNGTTCNPDPCHRCCDPITGACSTIPAGATQCQPPLVQYFATSCSPTNPCPQTGACCVNGQCSITLYQNCNGTWLGPNTVCTPGSCRVCCDIYTGSCTSVIFGGGFWACPVFSVALPGTTCSPNPCPQVGACCDQFTGNCFTSTQAACINSQGTAGIFLGTGTVCPPPPCKTGVCCTYSGQCFATNNLSCPSTIGVFNGATVSCNPNPCTGACCYPPVFGGLGSTCFQQTIFQCHLNGGQWRGFGTTCTNPPPANNFVACCKANCTGSGGLTVQDIFCFLTSWFAHTPYGDFNNSGTWTVQDIFDFLTAYFYQCH